MDVLPSAAMGVTIAMPIKARALSFSCSEFGRCFPLHVCVNITRGLVFGSNGGWCGFACALEDVGLPFFSSKERGQLFV